MAIVLFNDQGRLFWAKRVGMDAWQFPQGGIRQDESADAAMFRELHEEVGLLPEHVEVVGVSRELVTIQAAEKIHPTPHQTTLHRSETALVSA